MPETRYATWPTDENPGLEYEYANQQAKLAASGAQGNPPVPMTLYKLVPIANYRYEAPPVVLGKIIKEDI